MTADFSTIEWTNTTRGANNSKGCSTKKRKKIERTRRRDACRRKLIRTRTRRRPPPPSSLPVHSSAPRQTPRRFTDTGRLSPPNPETTSPSETAKNRQRQWQRKKRPREERSSEPPPIPDAPPHRHEAGSGKEKKKPRRVSPIPTATTTATPPLQQLLRRRSPSFLTSDLLRRRYGGGGGRGGAAPPSPPLIGASGATTAAAVVRFADPLVTESRTRPRTRPGDIGVLFYSKFDEARFREDVRSERRLRELGWWCDSDSEDEDSGTEGACGAVHAHEPKSQQDVEDSSTLGIMVQAAEITEVSDDGGCSGSEDDEDAPAAGGCIRCPEKAAAGNERMGI